MTQKHLNEMVAAATGEDLHEIRHRGFSLVDPFESNFDPEPDDLPPQRIDWDELDLQRQVAFVSQPRRVRVA
jgi:hypothetical protein